MRRQKATCQPKWKVYIRRYKGTLQSHFQDVQQQMEALQKQVYGALPDQMKELKQQMQALHAQHLDGALPRQVDDVEQSVQTLQLLGGLSDQVLQMQQELKSLRSQQSSQQETEERCQSNAEDFNEQQQQPRNRQGTNKQGDAAREEARNMGHKGGQAPWIDLEEQGRTTLELIHAINTGDTAELRRVLLDNPDRVGAWLNSNMEPCLTYPAVFYAASMRQPECLELLLEFGGDPMHIDSDIGSPLDGAKSPKKGNGLCLRCMDVLLAHGAKPYSRAQYDRIMRMLMDSKDQEAFNMMTKISTAFTSVR